MIQTQPNFVDTIITSDEIWCFAYDPETKRPSAEWVGENSPRSQKWRFQKLKVKTMLIVFFYYEGIVHREFIPEGSKVNGAFYQSVLDHLCKKIARVRLSLWKDRSFFLLHDNVTAHSAAINTQFLARKMVLVLSHFPYSPDLSPLDYFMFPKLKMELKGDRFASIEEIFEVVTRNLNLISMNNFSNAMGKLE